MVRKRSNSSKSATISINFPSDLVVEILGRLPVKTLLKFRCVCKEWQSLIDSPNFASLHFRLYNSNPQNPRLFLTEGCGYFNHQCFLRRVDNFRKTCQLVSPEDSSARLRPVGYVNGLVLYSRYEAIDHNATKLLGFVLWNPLTRKLTDLPPPPGKLYKCAYRVVFVEPPNGTPSNDYKLVVIPHHYPINPLSMTPIVSIRVYSFSQGCWIRRFRIYAQCVQNLMYVVTTVVPFNGAVHWIGHNPRNKGRIVAFDVQNYACRFFRFPPAGIRVCEDNGVLCALRDSLVMLKLELEQGCCDFWVMEKYGEAKSWVNRFKIDMGCGDFAFLERNGKFYFTMEKRGVKVYDTHSGETMILSKSYRGEIDFMDTFMETLLLLPEGNRELN